MSQNELKIPKKLIEVNLPLDDINDACVREKAIRHGHPSTFSCSKGYPFCVFSK